MILTQLGIDQFRNLRQVELSPGRRFNLLTGSNGAGKSSVLEAIHCLSTGHSFRTRRAGELIRYGSEAFHITAQLLCPRSAATHRAGLNRNRDGTMRLRVDYEERHGFAELTKLLPVKALVPDSHRLIQEGPNLRRQYMDWGAFHVEQRFADHWRVFRRALVQRNHALRAGAPDKEVEVWNAAFFDSAMGLDACRRHFLGVLHDFLTPMLQSLQLMFHVELDYRSGWSSDRPLDEQLSVHLERCRRFRTTTIGPHRADLAVRCDGVPAKQILSRGQQKLLVYALHLVQVQMLSELHGRYAVILCDDLLAELDTAFTDRLIARLSALQCQVFITATDGEALHALQAERFHVEHGEIKKAV